MAALVAATAKAQERQALEMVRQARAALMRFQSLRIKYEAAFWVLFKRARVGVAHEFFVEETVDCKEKAATRAAITGNPVRGREVSTHPAYDQDSSDSNTCIANNVLSRRDWNVSLPRFVKRSSPKSNFISL